MLYFISQMSVLFLQFNDTIWESNKYFRVS